MRSIRSWIVPAALAVLACGCTHDQLRRSTSNTEQTMADLRYQGILNNLAMMAHNPAALPNPVAVSSGVVQISDNGNAAGNVTWNPFGNFGITQYFLGIGGSRTVSEQWALTPLHNPEKLRLMRCAFQILLDSPMAQCSDPACGPDCVKRLHDFLGDEEWPCAIPKGWFSVGGKHDVPKDACFVAHYCDTYVWVMPDGIDGLSRFTITILRIALTEQQIPSAQVERIYNGPPVLDKLKETDIRTVEPLPIGDQPKGFRPAGEVQPGPTGLQFVPGR